LFSRYPKLGALLTRTPWQVFVCLSLASLILFIPSAVLNIASIPLLNGDNVGFLHSIIWLIPYPLALPLIFALFARLAQLVAERTEQVVRHKVIRTRTNDQVDDVKVDQYFDDLRKEAEPGTKAIIWLALALTVIFITTDTVHLFRAVHFLKQPAQYQKEHEKPYEILDWTFAYAFPQQTADGLVTGQDRPIDSWRAPKRWSNLTFDVLAWTFEGIYVFMGFLWVFTYGWFLKKFADLMIGEQTKYIFCPQIGYEEANLGLKPIGILYNIYLSVVVIFGFMAVSLRLQYIPVNCKSDFSTMGSYLASLWKGCFDLKSLDAKIFAFHCLNNANVWYLACYALAIFVIIYFPIIRLTSYLRTRIDATIQAKHDEMVQAKQEGNELKEKVLRWEVVALKNAQVWPNGDKVALAFLFIIICLYAIAVTPAVLPLAVVIGTGLGFWKLVVEALFKRATRAGSSAGSS